LGAILGNLVFGYLVEVQCAVPILMVAALLIGSQGLLSFGTKAIPPSFREKEYISLPPVAQRKAIISGINIKI
jgi:hypothetical protein